MALDRDSMTDNHKNVTIKPIFEDTEKQVPLYVRGWCKTNCDTYGKCDWEKDNCDYYTTPQWMKNKEIKK